MAMRHKKIRLRYKKERVLFSDVLPYELPFIFTNRYFYRFLVKNQIRIENDELKWDSHVEDGVLAIIKFLFNEKDKDLRKDGLLALSGKESRYFKRIPFTYCILHKPTKSRELTIIHPVNQIQMVDFYDKYRSLMLYYTNLDRFSLRHPSKVACYFYYKDRLHHTLLGRKTDKLELFFNEYENLRTYFSYERYNNIYKFYEDYRYQRAEKKFTHLLKFDIQSCFDSIYTHSISWATGGGRSLYKEHFVGSIDDTFASIWDQLMELMNYNETNGIVIGPEFSRIFAEIILQHVDQRVEVELLEDGEEYRFNKDYVCYRYVDDYFLFYNDEKVKDRAMSLFANILREFKMSINAEKTVFYERPFITDITRAKIQIDELIGSMLHYHQEEPKLEGDELKEDLDKGQEVVEDSKQINAERIDEALVDKSYLYIKANEFNKQFKAILTTCGVKSKDVVNYTLARICRKLETDLNKFDKFFKVLSTALTKEEFEDKCQDCQTVKMKKEKALSRFLLEIIDSVFFLYSNNKYVNTTLKVINILNNIIIMLDNPYVIGKENVPRFSNYIRDIVFKKIQDEISLVFQTSNLDENTQIETLYYLIILRSLRSKYHLPANELQNYMGIKMDDDGEISKYPDLNALSIIILLYYLGNEEQYEVMKKNLMMKVFEKFDKVSVAVRSINAELTILTLDLLTCPYISQDDKRTIAGKMKIFDVDFENMLRYFKKQHFMFTRWVGVDITKELNAKISQEVYS